MCVRYQCRCETSSTIVEPIAPNHQIPGFVYDDYAHDRIPRRLFSDKLSTYAVGGATVGSLLSFISPDYVEKIQVRQDDPKLKSEFITYDSPNGGGAIKGLLSRPVDADSLRSSHPASSALYECARPTA